MDTESAPVGLPDRLRELVTQPDTVLFVGSGASAWSGYPTWPQLLRGLADRLDSLNRPSELVRRELDQGDLIQAASFGFDHLTKQEQAEFLRGVLPRIESPSPLHTRIATLGPTCFITTNYDQLIERAIREAEPNRHFQVVTNVNLVESATIIQAHARDYIFKPHGDVDAVESIVFTREQYRELQGQQRHVFETLKTLLASRPVIFIGFGLRDPDFLLIKDALATIYQGAVGDHYAFLPDITEEEISYWRRHHGIHLVTYPTDDSSDEPQKRHRALLSALDRLATTETSERTSSPTEHTLSILRHLQRMQQLPLRLDGERIPLMASIVSAPDRMGPWEFGLHRTEIVEVLCDLRQSIILIGQPGAGKTIVARSTVASLAKTAIESILEDPSAEGGLRIPVYLELKGYEGSLRQMLEASLPVDFPLNELLRDGQLMVFLDALNEVPNAALESNAFQSDLNQFNSELDACTRIYVTRFAGENRELDLPEVEVDSIPNEYLSSHLAAIGKAEIYKSSELRHLLSRPVFFRFFREHGLPDDIRTPHDVYRAILARYEAEARQEIDIDVSLSNIFAGLGFRLVSNGEQLIGAEVVIDHIVSSYPDIEATELLNWLVSKDVLLPHAGGRVALFHHSVTEYMAALALAERAAAEPELITACLTFKHWDHSLLLALGFFPPEEQENFLLSLVKADPGTALRSLSFLDDKREHWTTEILKRIGDLDLYFENEWSTARELSSVELTSKQEPLLETLTARGNQLGGQALASLIALRGHAGLQHALDTLLEHRGDFNFASRGGEALVEIFEPDDLPSFLAQVERVPILDEEKNKLAAGEDVDTLHGLQITLRSVFASFELQDLLSRLGDPEMLSPLIQVAVLDDLRNRRADRLALAWAVSMLPKHPHNATVALNFLLQFGDPDPEAVRNLNLESILPVLLDQLSTEKGRWAGSVLRGLAEYSDHWSTSLNELADNARPDTIKPVLHWAAGNNDGFFHSLQVLLDETEFDWDSAPTNALHACEVAWEDHIELLFSLLGRRDAELTIALIEKLVMGLDDPQYLRGRGLDDIEWWIDWIADAGASFLLHDRLSRFVGMVANELNRVQLIALFENGSESQRRALAYGVLPHISPLGLEELTDKSVEWLLNDLSKTELPPHGASLLGQVATEPYVEETLLPLLRSTTDGRVKENLVLLLINVGHRHGRRYVTADGEPIEAAEIPG